MAKIKRAAKRVVSGIKEAILSDNQSFLNTSNFYIQEEVFSPRQLVPVPRQKFTFSRPTVMAFADDAPLYNWAHPCRYLLYDAESGEQYSEISAQFPPYATDRVTPKSFYAFHEPVLRPDIRMYPIFRYPIWRFRWPGKRYAILFSGMSNNRHTNDLEFAYRMLIHIYGFSPANITVLNYDGSLNYSGNPQPATAWPGDGSAYQMPVHGAGTRAKLLSAIDALKSKLQPDDLLFIHTNNHGGHNGIESDLCCYPSYDSLGVKDFTDKLAELPRYRCLMVMMEQCHSGGFNNLVISKSTADNTSIASACTEYNNSIGGAQFDPFARDWIAAMMGHDPYGNPLSFNPDSRSNGRVSAKEAFDYANAIHDSYDTPVFNYAGGGRSCWLGRSYFHFPVIELISIESIIRKRWPEPDPEVIRRVIESIDKDTLALEERTQAQITVIQQEYEKQVEVLLQNTGITKVKPKARAKNK